MSEQPPDDPAAAAAAAAADGAVHVETDVETDVETGIEPDLDIAPDGVSDDSGHDVDVQDATLDAEPAPTEVAPTGDEQVDSALARLPELDRLATAEHVPVYEDVHRSLQEALGAAGSGAGSPGGPRPGVPGPPRR
ncbi:MAG: hypothetical protein ACTHOD_13350 [Motilibacteraceae bacterium]